MNSRTSRPRSPTSEITLTCAEVDRAIMPISEDLPTPEPAKMPRRWPRPHGTSVSSARTPRLTRSLIRGRVIGSGGAPVVSRHATPSGGSKPSKGFPRPSITRPSSGSPTATRNGRPVGCTLVPGPIPWSSPSGISSVRPPRKPTTSVATCGRSRPSPTMHTSPISTCTPVASMISPIRSLTRPTRRERSAPWRTRSARRKLFVFIEALTRERGRDDLPGPGELRVEAGVDLARVGPRDRAAAADPAVGLNAEVLDPAELRLQLVDAFAHQFEIVGVHDQRHAAALGQVAQRVPPDVDHALGLDRDHAGEDLLGEAHRHFDCILL